jgi:ACT domain-containing protein
MIFINGLNYIMLNNIPNLHKDLLTESLNNTINTKDKLDLLVKAYSDKIIDYLKKTGNSNSAEISKELKISYEDTIYILQNLQKQNKIVIG